MPTVISKIELYESRASTFSPSQETRLNLRRRKVNSPRLRTRTMSPPGNGRSRRENPGPIRDADSGDRGVFRGGRKNESTPFTTTASTAGKAHPLRFTVCLNESRIRGAGVERQQMRRCDRTDAVNSDSQAVDADFAQFSSSLLGNASHSKRSNKMSESISRLFRIPRDAPPTQAPDGLGDPASC